MKGFSTGARGALNALDLARAKNRLGRHVIIRAERARKSLAFQWQRQCGAFVERHLGQRLAHAEPQSRDTPRCPASIVIHAESVNRGEPMKPTDRRIWPRHWVCLAPKIGFAPRQMVLRGTELVGSAEYSQVNSPKCRHLWHRVDPLRLRPAIASVLAGAIRCPPQVDAQAALASRPSRSQKLPLFRKTLTGGCQKRPQSH